jgi:hypothetical protein
LGAAYFYPYFSEFTARSGSYFTKEILKEFRVATITVPSQIVNEGVTVNWNKGVVAPSLTTPEEKVEWSYLVSRGLYGKYGHTLDLKDCLFTDLVIALSVLVGRDNLTIDSDGWQQWEREKFHEGMNPIPDGAAS